MELFEWMDKLWKGGKQDPSMVDDSLIWIDWNVVVWYVGGSYEPFIMVVLEVI